MGKDKGERREPNPTETSCRRDGTHAVNQCRLKRPCLLVLVLWIVLTIIPHASAYSEADVWLQDEEMMGFLEARGIAFYQEEDGTYVFEDAIGNIVSLEAFNSGV